MEDFKKVYTLYFVNYQRFFYDDKKEMEETTSAYLDREEAERVALALCKMWLENPFEYRTIIPSGEYGLAVYKVGECDKEIVRIRIEARKFVEVG